MKQSLKTIIQFSLLGAILGLMLFLIKPISSFGFSFMMISLLFGQFAGLFFYLMDSNIFKTMVFKIMLFGLLVFIIGNIFKIQHWKSSALVLFCSFLIISISYFIRFLIKKNKTLIDYTKVIWLILVILGYYFKIMHWIYADLFMISSFGIFWLGLLYMIFIDFTAKKKVF